MLSRHSFHNRWRRRLSPLPFQSSTNTPTVSSTPVGPEYWYFDRVGCCRVGRGTGVVEILSVPVKVISHFGIVKFLVYLTGYVRIQYQCFSGNISTFGVRLKRERRNSTWWRWGPEDYLKLLKLKTTTGSVGVGNLRSGVCMNPRVV